MKTIIAIAMLIFAAPALARNTVTIQPGQCILIGHTNVCAATNGQVFSNNQPTVGQPYYPNHPTTVVVEPVQELAPYAYCSLTENKSPNTWNLYRQGGTTKHRMNQFVKSFPHFEGSACQAEADRINQRS